MGFFEIFAGILAFFYGLVKSYGLAIILLTLLTRIVLLPLSIKQTRSIREMQVIQPEVKRIQAKYKGDRQKMNEEMMKLYKEHGVNPFGGCLPLLLQMPVLIGLFYVIRNPLNYMDAGTALATDLKEKALAVNQFLGIRLDCFPSQVLSGDASDNELITEACGDGFVSFLPYALMILVMGFTTYYQQRQMQASRSGGADSQMAQQMQLVGKIMPIMLMVFAFNFPTGVVIYWLTTNVWTIIQQRIILKAAPQLEPGTPTKAKAKAQAAEAAAAATDPQVPPTPSKPHPSSKKKKKR